MPRKGFLTPSSFKDLMTNSRDGHSPGKAALKLIDKLALDILGVEENDEDMTPISCQWGYDNEWAAIQLYQERNFKEVQCPVEFRRSKTHPFVGGTMDGLVGDRGGVEVKCPYNSVEHLNNLKYGRQIEALYKYQIQGYMWIYELDWIDFISYDPRFPEEYKLFVKRITPDKEMIQDISNRCDLAYDLAIQSIKEMKDNLELQEFL